MKRLLLLLLVLSVFFGLASCSSSSEIATEKNAALKLDASPLKLSFSSGVGAWSTELTLNSDGTFSGYYMDSDMGSSSDEYPDGTTYICDFSGKFENIKKINSYTYSLTLGNVITAKEYGEEWIEDSIRYIASPPYGIYDGKEFHLYTPDAPIEMLNRSFLAEFPTGSELPEKTLGIYGLYNIETGDSFFSFE